jgi:Fe-S cluster assembly scaffold protein SufB
MRQSVFTIPEFSYLRKNAKRHLERFGIPTTKNENWSYVNLSKFGERNLTAKQKGHVLISGIQNKKGVRVVSLSDKHATFFVRRMISEKAKIKKLWQDSLEAINLLNINAGVVLIIDKRFKSDQPIVINNNGGHCRNLVIIEQGAQATIFEKTVSADNNFINNVTEVLLDPDTDVEWVQFQNVEENIKSIKKTRFFIKEKSKLNFVYAGLGSQWSRQTVDAYLLEQNAKADFYQLLTAFENQHNEFYSCIDHVNGQNEVNQLTKMVVGANGKSVFSGKIKIRKNAQKAQSDQLSRSLLLSKNCRAINKPQLEIDADDVKATHGAAYGNLQDEEIFYLQSRGISKLQAEVLLTKGFVDEILLKVNNLKIRDFLSSVVHEKFNRMVHRG